MNCLWTGDQERTVLAWGSVNTPPTSVHFATHYIPCSIVPLTVYTYIRMYIRTSLPPLHPSSIPPPFQSSLEVIISQNDNALGVFSLTETTFALNDDDQSSIMVAISRTGGQLDGVTVCLQMCVPQWSMTSEALHYIHQPLLSHTDIHVAINPILVHPPLPSPPPQLEWSVDYTNLQQLQVLLSSLFVETQGRVIFSAGQTTASFSLALQPTNVSAHEHAK